MSLGAAERPLRDLLATAGWQDAPIERLSIEERPKVLATPWPIAPLTAAALGAVGLAASRIRELRTGERLDISLDTREAELAMASSSYLLVDGKSARFRDPFTGFYEAAQGEWVYLHGNFPHLRDGLLALLGVANEPDAVRTAVAARRGYDGLVQATTGMAMDRRQGGIPALLPCQPLDYLTGYLAAFAAMLALIRRHEQGGRWQATLSLAATAHWMWRMRDECGDDAVHPPANPDFAAIADLRETHDTAFGRVSALQPALRFNGVRAAWSRLPVPLGSDPARWPFS